MKAPEQLEEIMHRWVPRKPSPRVSERLFDESTSAKAPDTSLTRELFQWIVPVTGCVLLVLSTLPGRLNESPALVTDTTNSLFALASGSSGNPKDWQSELRHSGLNNVPRKTLQWTMGSDNPSITPNLIYTATNFLNR